MLPECRTEGDLYSIPKFTVEKSDVDNFLDELREFHKAFHDGFSREEPRENFYRYMAGQFSELERKSIEPIALNMQNAEVRSLQRFVSDVVWDENVILSKYRSMLNDELGDADGVLIFDETGFPKKGNDSIGVAKQYCGTLGKVENCQVGVFAAYASRHGYGLLDKRLFIPEKWFGEEYEKRRKKCKLPDTAQFKTKPQLAKEMFLDIRNEQVIPFKYVLADTLYGSSPEFIEAIESCIHTTYFTSISCDTLCWLDMPSTEKKQYKYKGDVCTKQVLKHTEKKPITVDALARSINDYFWYRRKVSEGTKGPIEYEFSKREVVLSRDGLPWKTLWLVVKRSMGDDPQYSFYISNALASTRLKTFVWLSGMRWPVEQCFEETKTELGMDHYEVRKYPGWNHHILTCMVAHFFLWHLKIRLGKKSTRYYIVTD